MNTSNEVLMQQARASLSNKWGSAALATLLIFVITILGRLVPFVGSIVGLIISGPIALGCAKLWLSYAREQETPASTIFRGFDYFAKALVAQLRIFLFVFLWSLLLIVPGIIASFSYAMTFFIMADDPSIMPRDAILKSKAMMKGNRMKFFYLSLRFIGWEILGLLTLGIGFFWIVPYYSISFAKFYEDIKNGVEPTLVTPESPQNNAQVVAAS